MLGGGDDTVYASRGAHSSILYGNFVPPSPALSFCTLSVLKSSSNSLRLY